MNFLKAYFWRLLFTAIGFIVAISFLTIGFCKTMLIVLLCGFGYLIGVNIDKGFHMAKRIIYWINSR